MQHQLAVGFGAPERGCPHARVQRAEVVVQGVQVLQEVARCRPEHLQYLVVARVLAELEERLAEQLQYVTGRYICGFFLNFG